MPSVGGLFAFQFFSTFALNLYPLYIPLYAMELGARREMLGPLVAASWLVFAVVEPVGGRLSDQLPQRGGLILMGLSGMVVISLALGSIGWLSPPHALGALVLLWALLAVPDGLSRPAMSALAMELAPSQERGRFMGALGSCAALAQVVAPVSYGFIADRLSLHSAFLVSSGAFLLALLSMTRVPDAFAPPPAALNPSSGLQ
jgi:MFS family permease